MIILVIGGAGYIGSHVTRELLDNGHRCVVYDNLSSGLKENLFKEAGFHHGDIHDYQNLLSAMKFGAALIDSNAPRQFDAIIHLAASKAAGESMIHPEKYAHNNIAGTINILNAACETGIKNIVFSSSAAVYGEPQYLPIDEKHPVNPENFYGFTKLEIERILEWYARLKNFRYAILRYFNAAGYDVKGRIKGLEQNPANLLPIIMETARGIRAEMSVYGNDYQTPDGTCIRDYIHVNDLASGHLMALNYINKKNKCITVNLGSENGFSVTQVLEASRKITRKSIPAKIAGRRSGDPAKLTASCALAFDLLGWKAQHSDLETLIKTSWNVYKDVK